MARLERPYHFIPEDTRVIDLPDLYSRTHTMDEILDRENYRACNIEELVKLVKEDAGSEGGEMFSSTWYRLNRYAWPGMFELALSKIDDLIEGQNISGESIILRKQVAEKIDEYQQDGFNKAGEFGGQVKTRFWNYSEGLGRRFRLPKRVVVPYEGQRWERAVIRNLEREDARLVILPREKRILETPFEKGKLLHINAKQAKDSVFLHFGDRIQKSLEKSL